jgi:kelch-like protein 8/kelch-like protein 20
MTTARYGLAAASGPCPAGEIGSCIYAVGGAHVGGVLCTLEAFDPPLTKHLTKNRKP